MYFNLTCITNKADNLISSLVVFFDLSVNSKIMWKELMLLEDSLYLEHIQMYACMCICMCMCMYVIFCVLWLCGVNMCVHMHTNTCIELILLFLNLHKIQKFFFGFIIYTGNSNLQSFLSCVCVRVRVCFKF